MPPKNSADALAIQLQQGIQEINKNIDKKLDAKLDAFRRSTSQQIEKAVKDFEEKVQAMVIEIKAESQAEVKKIKSEVKHCYEFIKQIDKNNVKKLVELEKSQNIVMSRLYRPDIIITGLPAALPNLKEVISKIGDIYGVSCGDCDINQFLYIKNSKEVLIKFNSIFVRDSIMKKYYASRALKLNDLIGGELSARVFLNEHLTPMASKLSFLCRRLKKTNCIIKYKFRNGHIPQAEITKTDGINLKCDLFKLMEEFQDIS